MYKIKVKENSGFTIDNSLTAQEILNRYLIGLGIKPQYVNEFIDKPSDNALDSPTRVNNLRKGTQLVYDMLTKAPTTVFVMVDSDTDGWTSAAIIISYLRRRFPLAQIKYAMHSGKEHGIDLDIITRTAPDAQLIIIPDAGTNDFAQQEALAQLNKKVVVIDHHQLNDLQAVDNSSAIIINNQHPSSKVDKNYSGAGMSFLFIQDLDTYFFATSTPI